MADDNEFRTPWHVETNHIAWIVAGSAIDDLVVARLLYKVDPKYAKRIVECVNACAGMRDPDAEITALRESARS